MKIISITPLIFPDVKIIKFGRFNDIRGYFTETFRKSDFLTNSDISFFKKVEFVQSNESFSKTNTLRGLHFQWNPYMGKLVRVINGQMIDLILDIRKGSPTFGKIVGYEMICLKYNEDVEWIWVPPGFAHGGIYLTETKIEYLCTVEHNPECEAGISPLAKDIDWSLFNTELKKRFNDVTNSSFLTISGKDQNGMSLDYWDKKEESKNFTYELNKSFN